jgi:hypothetical protein
MPFMSVVPFATSPGSDDAGPAHTDAADARQRMLAVKRTLEEASAAVESLQGALAAQHELEQLLKQGRAHLQDLRARLQRAEEDRDRLHTELAEVRRTYQRDVDELQQHLDEQAAAHRRFAEEREDERSTFTRLLNEAALKERELMEERDQQRQQIEALREAGMRAQSLAREIMRAHEAALQPAGPPE